MTHHRMWGNFVPGDTYNRPSRCEQSYGAHRYPGPHGDGELEMGASEDRNVGAASVKQSPALAEIYLRRPSTGLTEGLEPSPKDVTHVGTISRRYEQDRAPFRRNRLQDTRRRRGRKNPNLGMRNSVLNVVFRGRPCSDVDEIVEVGVGPSRSTIMCADQRKEGIGFSASDHARRGHLPVTESLGSR